MSTTPRKETTSDLVASLEAKLNTAQQTNVALTADRKRMEELIRYQKSLLDLRVPPPVSDTHPFTATEVQARESLVRHKSHAFDAVGMVAAGDRQCGKSEATRQIVDAARERGDTVRDYSVRGPLEQESVRACNRRELEMTANPLEMKVTAKYWSDKYHELKRLHELESKVAADQVASLQWKLQEANGRGFLLGMDVGSIEERDILRKEVADLTRWKQEMLYVLDSLNLQEIGKELELPLGTDVSKNILPCIRGLKARIEGAEARARQEAEESIRLLNEVSANCRADAIYSTTPHFNHAILALGTEILRINKDNGWDVTKPSDWPAGKGVADDHNTNRLRKIGTNLALIHSEVSEALEAIRKLDRQNFEEEMADVLIRVLDTTHGLGINLAPVIEAKLAKNRGRGHKHGGKAI